MRHASASKVFTGVDGTDRKLKETRDKNRQFKSGFGKMIRLNSQKEPEIIYRNMQVRFVFDAAEICCCEKCACAIAKSVPIQHFGQARIRPIPSSTRGIPTCLGSELPTCLQSGPPPLLSVSRYLIWNHRELLSSIPLDDCRSQMQL